VFINYRLCLCPKTGYLDVLAIKVGHSHFLVQIYIYIQLDILQEWVDTWKIKINQAKSVHVTFATKRSLCPPVTMNNVLIPMQPNVKYLVFHLDQRLTWRTHIKTKRHHFNLKLRGMYWLLGRRSKLSLENKLFLYKCVFKPVRTYGIQLWACSEAVPYTNHPTAAVKIFCGP